MTAIPGPGAGKWGYSYLNWLRSKTPAPYQYSSYQPARGSFYLPAPEVEMMIGVSRSGSILSAGEETYTTDSTGSVVAEFTRDSLPGDEEGNIILVARVADNDMYGNLIIEKIVPWGRVTKPETGFFDQRTLWSTRFRTPPWLLFIAWSIIVSVWGTLIYLVVQIARIKKLGDNETGNTMAAGNII